MVTTPRYGRKVEALAHVVVVAMEKGQVIWLDWLMASKNV